LLENDKVSLVRVLDNLSTGNLSNLEGFMDKPNFEFFEGDIRNLEDCMNACNGIDAISHQAALGSVPRSINDPITSHNVNVNGFLNMLEAAKVKGINRFVYASSSSVYGDLNESPKVESRVGKLLSPYAATKMANELYAEVYSKTFGMTICGFRYFNVFGPRQDPNGPYAAVVPLFIKAALENKSPVINGDGKITRDFTPVINVVQINLKAIFGKLESGSHSVLNVACGQTTDLNTMWSLIKRISGTQVNAIYREERKGDILFSLADVKQANELLDYKPQTDLTLSMEMTFQSYKKMHHNN
jgi:UDP-N-acetylglucosamine 4-epimerase